MNLFFRMAYIFLWSLFLERISPHNPVSPPVAFAAVVEDNLT